MADYNLFNESLIHDTRPQKHNHTVRYTELSPLRFKNFWKD